ncbi:MAG: hypothetical protein IJJ23_12415 [Clostridia bacterium]|nr:hypothetical protein [Clostridia bacterium]
MRARERLLCAIRGEPVDRVPWSPFLAYYWESLPAETRSRGQFAYMREMGVDPLLRGFHHLVKYTWNDCDIRESRKGRDLIRTYDTPVGQLTERYVYSENGDTTFLVDHPVQEAEQFKVLQYMFEHLSMEPDQAAFEADLKTCGEDALLLPTIGVAMKTAFQSLVEHWAGTVNLVYALTDEPEAVEDCLSAMWDKDEQSLRLSLDSRADGFIFWEDSSTTNISPAYFKAYTMPEVNAWGRMIHESGKLLVHHACGHLRDLIPLMATTEIDAIESISPPPTGNISLKEAASMLPQRIALIGGLEPVRLLTGTVDQVIGDAEALLRDMKGRKYVLANSDSCPPGVEYEKFLAVTELVKRQG